MNNTRHLEGLTCRDIERFLEDRRIPHTSERGRGPYFSDTSIRVPRRDIPIEDLDIDPDIITTNKRRPGYTFFATHKISTLGALKDLEGTITLREGGILVERTRIYLERRK